MKNHPINISQALTQSQLLLWTGQQFNPEAPLYNMVLVFHISGPIDVEHFQRAFRTLVDQSDAMRTVFETADGIPRQRLRSWISDPVEYLDLSGQENVEQALQSWIAARSQRIFDLSECCFDAVLIRRSDSHFTWYFNQHHLIIDAWGVTVQYKALAELYHRSLAGTLSEASPLPSFRDYVEYEREVRSNPRNASTQAHWTKKSSQLPPPPPLYGETGGTSTTHAPRMSVDLGVERSGRLRHLSLEPDVRSWTQHLALFNIFATILFAYLYRVSGQRALAIGSPAHNRPTTDFKRTPGVFIEIFPLLATIEADDDFNALLQRVRAETNEFLRYAQPGSGLPDLNRNLHVILNYITATFSDFGDAPMQSQWVHTGHCDPQHDIRVQVYDFDDSGSIQVHFDLNEGIFDADLKAHAPYHFMRLLDAFIDDRRQLISKPNLVSEKEHAILGIPFTPVESDAVPTVLSLFEAQVARSQHIPALSFKGAETTYAVLNEEANRLAEHIRSQQQLAAGGRVALLLKRSPALVTSILGVMKAGCSYVPIATDYPIDRIAHIIRDAEADMVITQKVLGLDLDHLGIPVVYMDTDWYVEEGLANEQAHSDIQLDSTVYMMYTSGSTGRPKGVVISHRALANYVHWAMDYYVDIDRPVFPLFTKVDFDLTVTSLFLPLVTGGKMVIYEESSSGADLSLFEVIDENAVDVIKLTPSHLAMLQGKDLQHSRLRTMIVGGEQFGTHVALSAIQTFGPALRIFNEYGPTEATVGCVVHRFDPSEAIASVPIGRPVANARVYVLDEFDHIVPRGVAGELCISGPNLADGYWARADLTSDRFNSNPYEPGQTMYRTGDLVRYNADLNLEYLGRMDQQVKIGGVRIELEEIEQALNGHDDIQACVVNTYRRQTSRSETVDHCTKCGLPSNYPSTEFDEQGICNYCRSFASYEQKVEQYFKTEADLRALFDASRAGNQGQYDCMMLYSGGKDSTYALARLVEMDLRVLAFTLDNGYISEQAKANIRRTTDALGVDVVFGSTPAMNAIFADSLERHCNVCNGCFKTIYTLGMQVALEKNIPIIVTGLSRGQFFETRLTEELFWKNDIDVAAIDQMILEARKAYHRVDDAVKQHLDVSMFQDDSIFDRIRFVDFYRYSHVRLEDVYTYLDQKLPWVRPTDTGRSTNCLINKVGIYVHTREKGYSNYAFPYSWDVRVGHKNRDAAIEEINEAIDPAEVRQIMNEIEYNDHGDHAETAQLAAYYVAPKAVLEADLRQYLSQKLPAYMIPTHFKRIDTIPMTNNGKIDRAALSQIEMQASDERQAFRAPETNLEALLAEIWSDVLRLEGVGVDADFIGLGGHSLAAIRIMARINETLGLDVPLNQIFESRTIANLAESIEAVMKKMLSDATG